MPNFQPPFSLIIVHFRPRNKSRKWTILAKIQTCNDHSLKTAGNLYTSPPWFSDKARTDYLKYRLLSFKDVVYGIIWSTSFIHGGEFRWFCMRRANFQTLQRNYYLALERFCQFIFILPFTYLLLNIFVEWRMKETFCMGLWKIWGGGWIWLLFLYCPHSLFSGY